MYLNKLLLKEFGKFHNTEINLKPGMNLLYGEKDAGKTTVSEFVSGIFYGLEGSEEKRPRNGRDFSGKAYMKKDNASYLIERTFFRNAAKTSVLDIQSGREKKLSAPNTLQKTMIETDCSTYNDVMRIGEAENDPKDAVKDCLKNISETGTTYIQKEKAISFLKAEKKKNDTKPLIRRLDELTERLEEYDSVDHDIEEVDEELKKLNEEFAIETAKRKRVARKMVEHEDGSVSYEKNEDVDKELDKLEQHAKSMYEDKEEDAPVKLTDRLPVIFATGLLVILVIAAIVYMMPFESAIRKLFIIFTVIFVIFTIIDGLRVKGFFEPMDVSTPSEEDFKKVLDELEEERAEQEAIEFDTTYVREYTEKKEALKKKENALLEERTKRNALRAEFNSVFKKKSELESEIRSINLAIATINRQSENLVSEHASEINRSIDKMIAEMTGGKYQGIRIGENDTVSLREGGFLTELNRVPKDDADEIYLAVRLGIALAMCKEQIPLVLDDVCKNYNETQLINMMKCLKQFQTEQILLLTSNRLVKDVLEKQAVQFQFAEL